MAEITPENPLGMRSLKDSLAKGMWENYKQNLSLDWIFDKWYEKAFLVAMLCWSCYSIWRIFF